MYEGKNNYSIPKLDNIIIQSNHYQFALSHRPYFWQQLHYTLSSYGLSSHHQSIVFLVKK